MTGGGCMTGRKNGIIRASEMREKKDETMPQVRYSTAYPTGAERFLSGERGTGNGH